MHTAIANCIVCDAVKSNHMSAKKECKLMNRKVGEVGMIQIAILFVLIALAISIVADIREGR